jgi:hypothetical protein
LFKRANGKKVWGSVIVGVSEATRKNVLAPTDSLSKRRKT